MRHFETGATRDSDEGKYDFEGFYSPMVIERFGAYMHKHRLQADGELRDSDNWQKGIPKSQYMKSILRHMLDAWFIHRGFERFDAADGQRLTMDDVLCAIIFNAQGYLYEVLMERECQSDQIENKDRVCESCAHLDLRGDELPCRSCVDSLGVDGWEPR